MLETSPDFWKSFWLTIVDKGFLAILLLFLGYGANRWLERFKRQQGELLEEFKGQRALENDFAKLRDAKHIEFVEKQLSNFYWPIYMRLEIDNAVWERILDRENEDELRQRIGREIEQNVILPNHDEIVEIMESNIHLAVADEKTFQAMLKYIRHVAVYKSMRNAKCYDKDPIHLQEPWPGELFPLIKETVENLQNQYNLLVKGPKDQSGPTVEPVSLVTADHLSRLKGLANEYININEKGFARSVIALNKVANLVGNYIRENNISKDIVIEEIKKTRNDGLIVGIATAIKLFPEDGDMKRLLQIARLTNKRHARYRIVEAIGELYQTGIAVPSDHAQVIEILAFFSQDKEESLTKQLEVCQGIIDRRIKGE